MGIALHRPLTLHEFLAWEHDQADRFEFDGVQPVAMAGGTAAHATIQRNLLFVLTGMLRGSSCRPYGSELKIEVAGRIRYPDAFVVCSPVDERSTVVTQPVVIFEIISEGSINDDLVEKNQEYRATPSVARYVVLQQTHAGAVVFTRKGEDWVSEIVRGDGVLRMPELGIEFRLEDLYAGLVLGRPDRASQAIS